MGTAPDHAHRGDAAASASGSEAGDPLAIRFAPKAVLVDRRADGSILLRSPVPLTGCVDNIVRYLEHWAAAAPEPAHSPAGAATGSPTAITISPYWLSRPWALADTNAQKGTDSSTRLWRGGFMEWQEIGARTENERARIHLGGSGRAGRNAWLRASARDQKSLIPEGSVTNVEVSVVKSRITAAWCSISPCTPGIAGGRLKLAGAMPMPCASVNHSEFV